MNSSNGITPAALGTLLKGDLSNFMAASTPGGIEKQEAEGQKTFVKSEMLPREMSYGFTRQMLEKMGIVFGDAIDELFISCQLPLRWRKVPTEHSIWSDLEDDKGRKRASVFYKAAFYDRKAHISLTTRFSAQCIPEDNYKSDLNYEDRCKGKWFGVVLDSGKIIFKTWGIKAASYKQQNELQDQAEKWLIEHYPEWKDVLAYWD